MSFFSDLFHGNFGNLGHDIAADPLGSAAVGGGLALATGGLALAPELLGGAAAAEGGGLFSGLFGGAEAAGGAAAADAGVAGLAGAAPETALAFAGPEGLGGAEGIGAIDAATGGAGAGAGLGADLGLAVPGEANLAAGADAAATGQGGGGGFLNSLWEGAKNSVAKNPLGIGAAGVGLGLNLLKGNPQNPNQAVLQQTADQLGQQGRQFQQYLMDGTLPPALQASMKQATDAAKARIVSNHAAAGRPTDPSQNSALAQELNNVDMEAVSKMASAELDMMKTGLNETGLSTQLYEMLIKMDKQNNQDLMSAITNFASALGGGSRGGVTINTARA